MAIERVEGFDDSLAFLVAVDRYGNSIPPLKTPAADAVEVGKVFSELHGFKCELLLDEQATFEGLKGFLAHMSKTVTARDRAIFYFAGHGVLAESADGPMGYVLPQDANRSSMDKYLSMTDLAAALDALPCRHLLVILDCCFAGAFRWSSTRDLILAPELVHQERYKWFIRDAAWQVIASAAQDQLALDTVSGHVIGARDTDAAHSPFASALLDGLQGAADRIRADGTGDGVITTTELFLYIEDRFVAPPAGSGLKQTPLLWPMRKHDKGQFVFLVPGRTLDLPADPALDADATPWRGLKSYEASHAELFFGRSKVSEALLEQASRDRFVIVTGPSGIGKSSLVRAGLLPRLVGDDAAPPIVFRPGSDPFRAVASALRAANAVGDPSGIAIESSRDLFAAWIEASKESGRHLLVIDQLEELLTMSLDPTSTGDFLTALATELADPDSKLCVVCTVRSEFEPRFAQSALGPHWNAAHFFVPQMSRSELRRVVEGPANVRVVRFESEALMDRLVDEVVLMPGALPLLSFALSEMYRNYLARGGQDRTIAAGDYEALKGGVVGALQISANNVIEAMARTHQATARRVLERLVSIETGEYVRRRVSRYELRIDEASEDARVQNVIDRFDEARLIVTDEMDGDPQLELAHDALTVAWARLADWIREDARAIADLRRLTVDAKAWADGPASGSGLLWADPSRHSALTKLLQAEFPGLNAQERKFAHASVARARRNQLLRSATIFALVALTVGALVGAMFAWNRTKTAIARQLTIQSAQSELSDVSVALLLALEADRISSGTEVPGWSGILSRFQRRVALLSGHRSPVVRIAFGGQPHTLIATSTDATVRTWNYADGRPVEPPLTLVERPFDITAVEYSPAGSELITFDRRGLVHKYDARQGRSLSDPKDCQLKDIRVAGFSRDLSVVAIAVEDDPAVRLCDTANGKLINLPRGFGKPMRRNTYIMSVAFSRDGRLLAVGNSEGAVSIWDLTTYRSTNVYSGITNRSPPITDIGWGNSRSITGLAFSPDDQNLLIQRDAETVIVGVSSGHRRRVLSNFRRKVTSFAFSPNGQALLFGTKDGEVFLWRNEDKLRDSTELLVTYPAPITSIAFNLDRKTAAVGTSDGKILVVETRGEGVLSQPVAGPLGTGSSNSSLSVDGRFVALARAEPMGAVILEDITVRSPSSASSKTLIGHEKWVTALAFSRSGGELATASEDGSIRLWDTSKGALMLPPFTDHEKAVTSLAFDATGHILASGGQDGRVILRDTKDGRKIGATIERRIEKVSAAGIRVSALAVSPDSKRILAGYADGAVQLSVIGFPPKNLREAQDNSILDVAFSHDGTTILTASSDGATQIWDAYTRKPLGSSLTDGRFSLTRVAFNSDDSIIAGMATDGKLKVWASKSRHMIADVSIRSNDPQDNMLLRRRISTLAFDPADDLIRVADQLGNVSSININRGWLRAVSCAIANRNLSRTEWNAYVGSDIEFNITCPGKWIPPDDWLGTFRNSYVYFGDSDRAGSSIKTKDEAGSAPAK